MHSATIKSKRFARSSYLYQVNDIGLLVGHKTCKALILDEAVNFHTNLKGWIGLFTKNR